MLPPHMGSATVAHSGMVKCALVLVVEYAGRIGPWLGPSTKLMGFEHLYLEDSKFHSDVLFIMVIKDEIQEILQQLLHLLHSSALDGIC